MGERWKEIGGGPNAFMFAFSLLISSPLFALRWLTMMDRLFHCVRQYDENCCLQLVVPLTHSLLRKTGKWRMEMARQWKPVKRKSWVGVVWESKKPEWTQGTKSDWLMSVLQARRIAIRPEREARSSKVRMEWWTKLHSMIHSAVGNPTPTHHHEKQSVPT